MERFKEKMAALVVVSIHLIYYIVAIGRVDMSLFVIGGYLMIPLGLIWFAEELGAMTGYIGRGGLIDNESPTWMVSLFGWAILVGIPIYAFFFAAPQ